MSKNVKIIKLNPGLHFTFRIKHSLFTFFVCFVFGFFDYLWWGLVCQNAIYSKVKLASPKEGWGTLRRRRSAFSVCRVGAVMATTLLIDGASVFSIPLCPLTLFCHSLHLPSVENWDITLRKYQLHCLQYHMPVWTHLLLLVGEQQRETGTETERDKKRKETLRWSGIVILL